MLNTNTIVSLNVLVRSMILPVVSFNIYISKDSQKSWIYVLGVRREISNAFQDSLVLVMTWSWS